MRSAEFEVAPVAARLPSYTTMYYNHVLQSPELIPVSVSARLDRKTRSLLTRYCQTHGVTQTKAIEQGIHLLAERAAEGPAAEHPAWLAYQKIRERLVPEGARRPGESTSDAVKRKLRANHSR